ncbi:MAG: YlbG family protein [Sporolactobacillus sp.]|jgi:uncharacterized protein YlbG (UPF0298 family)|nr:YlbG family protein [Sporolactobacillus sp.]
MPIVARDGLIIWMYNTKYIRILRRYGYVHYVSKKMKYAVLYCNHDAAHTVVDQLKRLKFVRQIDYSHLQEVPTTYKKGKTIHEVRDEVFN